ncbi:hypothetical protein BXE05_23530 [Salmonella enterica subsp. enterica]|uniref:Uncharacterized protein n=5 Tax=Salmonella enterica TaxID=28901 RepID=A0A3U5NE02_SALET|nr:hypothetical protein [Salmonella enterica]EAA1211186.1 hypothetical protein [Salmonella enterica subsp. enterica serovar Bareilly]EAA2623928.1 hypothetical protein [Salmonella enterica subsp. enterica serovar Newport]EAA3278210.1 hypothetical protein [Salmonella enterica subsp. enterica serovar Brunei]EAA4448534.1 hypothetical protein [Salmonella enterica subsp. enterica]EAA7937568.1 hypothetical protein [Salmonella enterica subsp. enterica serovar Teko]EAC0291548.1 hypothetical protein [S
MMTTYPLKTCVERYHESIQNSRFIFIGYFVITVHFEIHICFTTNDNSRIMTDFPEHPDEYIHCKNRDFKPRHRS